MPAYSTVQMSQRAVGFTMSLEIATRTVGGVTGYPVRFDASSWTASARLKQ